jgi:hypothetical protein
MEPDEADRARLAAMLKQAFGEQLNALPARQDVTQMPPSGPRTVAESSLTRSGVPASGRPFATPLSFTPELLRAILSGRKTQTRRPIRPQPTDDASFPTPPYLPGDLIPVLEKWGRLPGDTEQFVFAADAPEARVRWNASRYMPHRAARTFLQVEAIEPARLTQISETDARHEGIDADGLFAGEARGRFLAIWDSIYGETAFAQANDPWVWVIRFSLARPAATS